MDMDWIDSNITTGSGGAAHGPNGRGGRGGDVGSHNRVKTSHANSHNQTDIRKHVAGDNYSSPVDQGDKYNGNITHSAVGGRGNSNTITNNGSGSSSSGHTGPVPQPLSVHETELNERIAKAREMLAAKKEKERLQKLEDELRQLKAELGESED